MKWILLLLFFYRWGNRHKKLRNLPKEYSWDVGKTSYKFRPSGTKPVYLQQHTCLLYTGDK
jgi:hypothetical protein